MINEQGTLKTATQADIIKPNIETTFGAIQRLADANQSLLYYVSYQKALESEKENLEHIIENLRDEKQRLALEVDKSKKSSDKPKNHSDASRFDLAQCSMSPRGKIVFESEDTSFRWGEEEYDSDSWEDAISTTSVLSVPNALQKSLKPGARKRRHTSGKHWSPKKWHRMVRTHRLQSIFIEDVN